MDSKDNIKYYAQELKKNTYNLTRMNLVMRGILPDNIKVRNGDTLEEDWPDFEDSDPIGTYEPLYVDAVTSNPPYSQKWDPTDKGNDPRYADYGTAPKGKADYAFLLHDLYHIKPDGIMTIVLPHGVLFRGGEEGTIRKNLIEKNKIDTIIGLPSNIFFGTGIPTIIMVLKQKRNNTDTLIIDASKGFIKEGKNNKLRACDIRKITDAIKNRKDIDKYCKVVSRDEIRANDYNLNIPRYVDSSEKTESYDIYASMFGGIPNSEINDYDAFWSALPTLKDELFQSNDEPYSTLKSEDVRNIIKNNQDVQHFMNEYQNAFAGFEGYLKNLLIDDAENLNIAKTEEIISNEIFNRLKNIPLINQYEAYQYLNDEWNTISGDIEIIQTEGIEAAKVVDPNMVLKRKRERSRSSRRLDWSFITIDLIQSKYLMNEKRELIYKENQVSEIDSEINDIIENLTDEEKEMEFYDDEGNKIVDKLIKQIIKDTDVELETREKLRNYSSLVTKKKELNKALKLEIAELELNTKYAIENLTYEQIDDSLNSKWIEPLMQSINSLPIKLLNDFESKIDLLSKKYETTYSDLEEEISKTEKSLISMLNDLEGNDYDMLGLDEFKMLLGGK